MSWNIVQDAIDAIQNWFIYLDILSHAERYVRIFTPYLILDETMVMALTFAAKRGVDVRLVLPGIPDKKLVFRLSRSYYLPLLRAGVRIYEYTPGFLHAKCCVSDDRAAVVGSINMDYRSMFLHFECGVLLLQNSQVLALRDDVKLCLMRCANSILLNMMRIKNVLHCRMAE